MVTNRIIFFATSVQPNPEEIDYWVDLSDNPYGGSIKYFNGTEWVRLAASGGVPDLNNYYTKTQVNKLLNDKANIGDVDSKVDDEEVKDVIKDIQFNTSNPNGITMVMFKYDGSNKTVSIPVASTSSAGIITSKDFLDFVKQHQLQELHTEMIDTFADIRAKYQKKLIAGLNIEIDQETNVISASGDLAVQWDNITGKPDFKPVATSGDYNDLINKLKPGKDVSISEDNVISIAIDSDSLEQSLATLQNNIDKEAATARAAETKLGNDIAIEKNRAKAKEEELDNKITDHTAATNAALALKADKSDTYTKAQVDAKLSGAYKVKGSSTFEALPKDNNVVGDVYNIINAFNLGGKHYDAGTNVVWTEDGWDALSGSFDTTAIEGSIQEVADNLAQEILDRTQADTTINNNVSSLTNRVKVNEDKLTIINGNESTTGSIANAIKQAKLYTDTTVTAEQTRAEKAEQKLTSDLASEVTRAKGAESANTTAIANEVERATGVEETLNSNITQLQTQKVDKVEGKGLSTNDYTTPEKNKLAAIEAEANKYVLPAATASALGGVKIGSNITLANGGTISITKNNVTSALGVDPTTKYVTLDTDQTITGNKSFNSDQYRLPGHYYHNGYGNEGVRYIHYYSNDEKYDEINTRPTEVQYRISNGDGSFKTIVFSNTLFYTMNKLQLGNDANRWGDIYTLGQLNSTVATGTAPIRVASTTLCTNLNADMVDGKNADAFSEKNGSQIQITTSSNIYVKLYTITSTSSNFSSYVQFVIGGRSNSKLCTVKVNLQQGNDTNFDQVLIYYDNVYTGGKIRGYLTNPSTIEIWYIGYQWDNIYVATSNTFTHGVSVFKNMEIASNLPTSTRIIAQYDAPEDWYGVSWSETSSNPDCIRIGNMDMHRSLPIQSMMKPFDITNIEDTVSEIILPIDDQFQKTSYANATNIQWSIVSRDSDNIMIRIPEFWYTDDYVPGTKTHNLKLCPHAKPGWYHHKEAYVSAYEVYKSGDKLVSVKGQLPTVNFNRTNGRTWARANGFDGEAKWNLYTYEEHRAICHLFLVEYATRNSQKAVNTELTPEGFRQGGLGSGCTTGTATINGAQTWSFIPTGSSDSLGSGSGEVTVTIQQTDQSGSNTSTITRKCNRYRGIENPFGHVWKHTDDVISVYSNGYRTWYKSVKPDQFTTNKNASYKSLCASTMVSSGYKTEIKATPTCDFFAVSVSGGSETTYWCDYNWDNTDASEHCLLIGGNSDAGGWAGLFTLNSDSGVGLSHANIGSRLTYLPWAE